MENKKYLDKVLGHLVINTKVDYNKSEIYTPFALPLMYFHSLVFSPPSQAPSFSAYSKKQFGLIDDEVKYIWEQYIEIINHKIENGK